MLQLNKLCGGVMALAVLFILTLCPWGMPAYAHEVLTVPVVKDGRENSLGTILMQFTAGKIKPGDSAVFRLPHDFELVGGVTVQGSVYGGRSDNYFMVPSQYRGNKNALQTEHLSVRMLDKNEFELRISDSANIKPGLDAYIYLYLNRVYVDDGFRGNINLSVDAASSSGFATKDLVAARVSSGSRVVKISADKTCKLTDDQRQGTVTIVIKESEAGTFAAAKDSVKVELPSGLVWLKDNVKVKLNAGKVKNKTTNNVEKDLKSYITINKDLLTLDLPSGFSSVEPLHLEIDVTMELKDADKVKAGDIVADLSGKSSIDKVKLNLGQYQPSKKATDPVKTPTPKEDQPKESGSIVALFNIGSTGYVVNGVKQTMDVAPYAKNNRTYLPVRYVGHALGVTPENIIWADQTATLIKDNTTVQITLGSKTMRINGAVVLMDVSPENNQGRIMLPLRWIAEAFGAQVDYEKDGSSIKVAI